MVPQVVIIIVISTDMAIVLMRQWIADFFEPIRKKYFVKLGFPPAEARRIQRSFRAEGYWDWRPYTLSPKPYNLEDASWVNAANRKLNTNHAVVVVGGSGCVPHRTVHVQESLSFPAAGLMIHIRALRMKTDLQPECCCCQGCPVLPAGEHRPRRLPRSHPRRWPPQEIVHDLEPRHEKVQWVFKRARWAR